MDNNRLVSKKEIYQQLGMSKSRFFDILKQEKIETVKGLMSPEDADWLINTVLSKRSKTKVLQTS